MTSGNEFQRKALYRSRRGAICGVCKGIADYLEIPVLWTRVAAVVLLMFSGIWPMLGIYFLAALLMKPEPVIPIDTPEGQAFYDTYTTSRSTALHNLKRTYDGLERRLRRLEDYVTGKEYDWDQRLRRGK